MASPKPKPAVVFSPTAVRELDDIWQWNAERHSVAHADAYLSYLQRKIDGLAKNHAKGKPVGVRPDLRYLLVRRKSKGHGHVAIYRVGDKRVDILHVVHTAQDWQSDRLLDDPAP